MSGSHTKTIDRLAPIAISLAILHLLALGALLMKQAFLENEEGLIYFIPELGKNQATKAYFFQVLAGLLACTWYVRRSRSKIPLAFGALACSFAGGWTVVAFSAKTVGALGAIPALLCAVLYFARLRRR